MGSPCLPIGHIVKHGTHPRESHPVCPTACGVAQASQKRPNFMRMPPNLQKLDDWAPHPYTRLPSRNPLIIGPSASGGIERAH